MELPAVNQRTASEQRHSRKTAITSPKASAACVLSACILLERADSSRQEDAANASCVAFLPKTDASGMCVFCNLKVACLLRSLPDCPVLSVS